MSPLDDESPNFEDLDDLMASGNDLPSLEPEMALPDELDAASLEPVMDLADLQAEEALAPEETEQPPSDQTEGPSPEKRAAMPSYVEWAPALAGAVILIVLALLQFIYFGTAFYLISVGLVIYGIWKERQTNTVYTAILGCTLIALLTAVYCLWIELARYHFNISAKQQAGVSAVFHQDDMSESPWERIRVKENC